MEKIASFTVNHLTLEPGLYVSRKDRMGAETVTTFDLRMTAPNREPVMNTAEIHTIEHLGATYLRNDPDSISCWPGIWSPEMWKSWSRLCSGSSGTMRGRYPALRPGTAGTTWT